MKYVRKIIQISLAVIALPIVIVGAMCYLIECLFKWAFGEFLANQEKK